MGIIQEMNFMRLLSSNYVEKTVSTEITFRFDSSPVGAENFRMDYKDPETEQDTSEIITGSVSGDLIIFDRKFPSDEFTLTNLTTNDVIPFETEFSNFKNELIFVNEDGYPTTYIKGLQARDVYQIIIKRMNGDVWNTFKYGDRTLTSSNNYTDDLDEVNSMTRICFDDEYDWMKQKITDEGFEEMGYPPLRQVIVEIDKWEPLEIKTFEKMMPTSEEIERTITSYQGLLDYDELGIDYE